LNVPLLVFTAVIALATGVLFGLFPALYSTRPDLLSALKGEAGHVSGPHSASRFRSGLATFQIALSMALLIAAGLLARSLYNISRIDLGLKTDRLITFSVSPGLNGYTPVRSRELLVQMESELAALPDVTGVTVSLTPLLAGSDYGGNVAVQGFRAGPDSDEHADYNKIGSNYFRTLGIPLIEGREFTLSDALGAPKVAIVNEQFTKKFNLGRDAIGKRMKAGRGGSELDIEIVGVVQNSKHADVKDPVPPVFFVPYRQDNANLAASATLWTIYVRTSSDTKRLLAAIQPAVARIDPNVPVTSLRTMDEQVQRSVSADRMITTLCIAFAGLATMLASIGLYGVLAYTVVQRTREFGVRMALGASPSDMCGLVLRKVALMTLIGGGIGAAVALGFGRFAESLLFEITGRDPVVLIASIGILAIVAAGAGLVPALRASRIDPMRALRHQ
jgi:predicted permease